VPCHPVPSHAIPRHPMPSHEMQSARCNTAQYTRSGSSRRAPPRPRAAGGASSQRCAGLTRDGLGGARSPIVCRIDPTGIDRIGSDRPVGVSWLCSSAGSACCAPALPLPTARTCAAESKAWHTVRAMQARA
jgi:hypothetical protein